MSDRVKIHVRRLIWLFIGLVVIALPRYLDSRKPELALLYDEVAIVDYYASLDETAVSIELTFNREVESGYVKISFYDELNNFLETKNIYLDSHGKQASNLYVIIKGEVGGYEILSGEFDASNNYLFYSYILLFPIGVMFVASLFLNYKEYHFKGMVISVYAGWIHHTLRINGEKYDEHTTLFSYVPIKLSTTVNDVKIKATVSRFCNRIALKINDKLA